MEKITKNFCKIGIVVNEIPSLNSKAISQSVGKTEYDVLPVFGKHVNFIISNQVFARIGSWVVFFGPSTDLKPRYAKSAILSFRRFHPWFNKSVTTNMTLQHIYLIVSCCFIVFFNVLNASLRLFRMASTRMITASMSLLVSGGSNLYLCNTSYPSSDPTVLSSRILRGGSDITRPIFEMLRSSFIWKEISIRFSYLDNYQKKSRGTIVSLLNIIWSRKEHPVVCCAPSLQQAHSTLSTKSIYIWWRLLH